MNVLFVVDTPNIYFNTKKMHNGRKVSYQTLISQTVGTDNVLYKQIAYCSKDAKGSEYFNAFLNQIGFEVKVKTPLLQVINKGTDKEKVIKKTNFAVSIAMDVSKYMRNVGCVIIVSNDVDLVPVVTGVKDAGVKCVIVGCGIPKELRDVADGAYEIPEEWLQEEPDVTTEAAK